MSDTTIAPTQPGKITPPDEHRIEKEVLVCDPTKADETPALVESDFIAAVDFELHQGFELLKQHKLSATFYGSARHAMGDGYYEHAENLAEKLSKSGFTIVTGGADGIMGAANKGAHKAGGASIGLNINLPMEQRGNKYTTDAIDFENFFTRKFILAYASELYVFFPGGYGTLDELFEILTLVQTRKIKSIPILLYGKEFWSPMVAFMERLYEHYKSIDREDLALYHVVDTVEEAYEKAMTLVKC